MNSLVTQTDSAQVLVLGYPQLFPETKREQSCIDLRQHTARNAVGATISQGFSHGEQQLLRDLNQRLNQAILEEVSKLQSNKAVVARIQFIPVADHFKGHEVCGAKGAWINGVSPAWRDNRLAAADKSFHPTATGQREYARCVNTYFLGTGRPCEELSF